LAKDVPLTEKIDYDTFLKSDIGIFIPITRLGSLMTDARVIIIQYKRVKNYLYTNGFDLQVMDTETTSSWRDFKFVRVDESLTMNIGKPVKKDKLLGF